VSADFKNWSLKLRQSCINLMKFLNTVVEEIEELSNARDDTFYK
jgi:hypothetical protein